MQPIVILAALLTLQQLLHSTTSSVTTRYVQCGRRLVQHEGLIIKGDSTKPGDWPWTAAINHVFDGTSTYKCGGTLLNSNTVITAAHCVYENDRKIVPQRVTVQLGKYHLLLSGDNTQEFQVHKITPHPDFNPSNLENDIALIHLSTEATFNNYVQPICLWRSDKTDLSEVINKAGVVTGWGTTETDHLSPHLKYTYMPVVSLAKCLTSNRQVFGSVLSETNFCAGFRNGSSACSGDSGGSLTFEENGAYHIRGIVSLSAARGNTRYCSSTDYVLFTDVAQYLSWIGKVVPDLNSFGKFSAGDWLTFQSTTPGTADQYLSFQDDLGFIREFDETNSDFQWRLVPGLANKTYYTIESKTYPGRYLRHQGYRIKLHLDDGSDLFKNDATWMVRQPTPGQVRFESYNYNGHYLRHYNHELWLGSGKGEGVHSAWLFSEDSTYNIH